MLLQMIFKAHPTQIYWGVTWTVRSCLFPANGARTWDVQRLTYLKFICVWVPFSLLLPTLHQHMESRSPGRRTRGRCRNNFVWLYCVCHHLHCQIPLKKQRWIQFLIPCTRPSLSSIHLCNRQQESKLPVRPTLRLPCVLQPDRIVVTIVYVINPVLPLVISAEGFRVPERLPLSFHAPLGWVTFDLVQSPVRWHHLCYVVCVLVAMNVEQSPPQILNEWLDIAQPLPQH